MANKSGFITKIDTRSTKFGDKHQVHIGSDSYIYGNYPPKGLAVGDFVTFETKMNGQYENLVAGTMVKADAPAGVAAPTPPQASTISMDRQDVISRQAAMNTAMEFIKFLQANEALPIAKTKAKNADMLEAILLEYTGKFFHINTGSTYTLPDDIAGEHAQSWDEQE